MKRLKNVLLWLITIAAAVAYPLSFIYFDANRWLCSFLIFASIFWLLLFVEVNDDYLFKKKIPLKRVKEMRQHVLQYVRILRCKFRSRRKVHLPKKEKEGRTASWERQKAGYR